MPNISDYLLLKTPIQRMSDDKDTSLAPPGETSARRLFLAWFGLVLGVLASFLVTDLVGQAEVGGDPSVRLELLAAGQLLTTTIVTLVVCMLSFPGLYQSLRLYRHEPALLLIFVAFQYGFFWQAALQGVSAVVGT